MTNPYHPFVASSDESSLRTAFGGALVDDLGSQPERISGPKRLVPAEGIDTDTRLCRRIPAGLDVETQTDSSSLSPRGDEPVEH